MSLLLALLVAFASQSSSAQLPPRVAFVSEQGAANLIAWAYFSKLAADRGLDARAVFRGLEPQSELSRMAVAGLMADGFTLPDVQPTILGGRDVLAATHIFAIGGDLSPAATRLGNAAYWDDVPDDQGYGPMRDAIVRHVEALIDDLARR